MNVVDSSAWLSYLAGDANARHFEKAIVNTGSLIVPSITLTEVFKSVLRQKGEDLALQVIAHMQQGRVIPLDSGLAIDAASIGVEHKLPLADSIIYATTRKYGAILWTQDADFKALDQVNYFPRK